MKTSKENLIKQADKAGFKIEILEKVWNLMSILKRINSHDYLKDRLVLKGGTALNLFIFNLPRLSVDIDLNYIGQINKDSMQEERPKIENALKLICEHEGFEMRRSPNIDNQGAHAGGKFEFRYDSVLGYKGKLEVDISYMYRTPLWHTQKASSAYVGGLQIKDILLLSPEEIAGGKLSALFTRKASRDLFDVHHLMHNVPLDSSKLKTTFLIYGIMGPKDLRNASLNHITFDKDEYYQNLIPVLTKNQFIIPKNFHENVKKVEQECQESIKFLLTFNDAENEFLDQFYGKGKLNLDLITTDIDLINKVKQHPLIQWRQKVLENKIRNFCEENVIKI